MNMNSQEKEKTMFYLSDLPYGVTILEIRDFLINYQNKIILINPD